MILLHEPSLGINEIKNLNSCIKSNWISAKGNFVKSFSKKLTILTKSKYILPVTSGTEALRIALKVLGANQNCEVIMPTISFIATANSAIYNNAQPLFIDINKEFSLDEKKTLQFLYKNTFKKNGHVYNKLSKKRIFAVLIVHPFGNCANFDDIFEYCKKNNIYLIEDAAESIGVKFNTGKFKGKHTGTVGDIGCFSFNGNKIVTTGGGGCLITNKKKIFKDAFYLCNQAKDDDVRYIHNSVGYNSLMSNISAAIGVAQIDKLKKIIERKKNIYEYYKKTIKNNKIDFIKKPNYPATNYWLNIIKIKKKINQKQVTRLIKSFHKNEIQIRPIWYPMNYQKMYKKNYSYKATYTKNIFTQHLCIPSSPSLNKKKLDKIIKIINKIDI